MKNSIKVKEVVDALKNIYDDKSISGVYVSTNYLLDAIVTFEDVLENVSIEEKD